MDHRAALLPLKTHGLTRADGAEDHNPPRRELHHDPCREIDGFHDSGGRREHVVARGVDGDRPGVDSVIAVLVEIVVLSQRDRTVDAAPHEADRYAAVLVVDDCIRQTGPRVARHTRRRNPQAGHAAACAPHQHASRRERTREDRPGEVPRPQVLRRRVAVLGPHQVPEAPDLPSLVDVVRKGVGKGVHRLGPVVYEVHCVVEIPGAESRHAAPHQLDSRVRHRDSVPEVEDVLLLVAVVLAVQDADLSQHVVLAGITVLDQLQLLDRVLLQAAVEYLLVEHVPVFVVHAHHLGQIRVLKHAGGEGPIAVGQGQRDLAEQPAPVQLGVQVRDRGLPLVPGDARPTAVRLVDQVVVRQAGVALLVDHMLYKPTDDACPAGVGVGQVEVRATGPPPLADHDPHVVCFAPVQQSAKLLHVGRVPGIDRLASLVKSLAIPERIEHHSRKRHPHELYASEDLLPVRVGNIPPRIGAPLDADSQEVVANRVVEVRCHCDRRVRLDGDWHEHRTKRHPDERSSHETRRRSSPGLISTGAASGRNHGIPRPRSDCLGPPIAGMSRSPLCPSAQRAWCLTGGRNSRFPRRDQPPGRA